MSKKLEHISKKKPPQPLEEIRTRVFIEKDRIRHAKGITHPDAFASLGIDQSFKLKEFINNMKIEIRHIDETNQSMQFDVIGVDTAIANALRRILLAEVPTMAIEEVTFHQNTSIIQDEVLAHRIGLLPIGVDPRIFSFVSENDGFMDSTNTLIFKLNMSCSEIRDSLPTDAPEKRYRNSVVYSRDLEWVPQPGQIEFLKKHGHPLPIKTVHDDILVAKLRPGQTIECWMKVVKGIGRNHAKWSPVGTAAYQLLPEISVTQPLSSGDAMTLVNLCPKKVFDIEDLSNGDTGVKVSRPRDCTMCRACISEPGWESKVKLRRVRDHFIFSVESIGQYPVRELFSEAVKTLIGKCDKLLKGIDEMKARESGDIDDDDNAQDATMEIMD